MKKKFSIIVSSFKLGGLEILIERLASYLSVSIEIDIYLLTDKVHSPLVNKLKENATVYYPSDYFMVKPFNVVGLNVPLPIKSAFRENILNSDFVHAVDSASLAFLNFCIPKESFVNLSVGCYQSEEYIWDNGSLFRKFDFNCLKNLPNVNFYTTNKITRQKLITKHPNIFSTTSIMPAGISVPKISIDNSVNSRKPHVVIVARLVKFKSYIEETIKVVNHICEEFPDFQLHIYGDGPEKKYLKNLANGLPVYFHGAVEINTLSSIISSCKLFLGSGTSIITASALGVPSIIGIESCREPVTYGFLHEIDGYDYNELGLEYDIKSISNKIAYGLKLSGKEYEIECLAALKKSHEFNISHTAELLLKSEPFTFINDINMWDKIIYFISYFLWSGLNYLGLKNDKVGRHFIEQ